MTVDANSKPIPMDKMTFSFKDLAQQVRQPFANACGCVGPQNGQPLCPCQMRGVEIKDGRYVRIQDLGPVR